jgi:hypothetical protein
MHIHAVPSGSILLGDQPLDFQVDILKFVNGLFQKWEAVQVHVENKINRVFKMHDILYQLQL